MTFESENKDCYVPPESERNHIIANTPEWLRRWFVWDLKNRWMKNVENLPIERHIFQNHDGICNKCWKKGKIQKDCPDCKGTGKP